MNNIIKGFLLILMFQLFGTVINEFFLHLLPGSIIGMLLLFISLQLGFVKEVVFKDVVGFIMKNMSFFFIAPAVGIVSALPLIGKNLNAIILVTVVSTIAVIFVVGRAHQWLSKRK